MITPKAVDLNPGMENGGADQLGPPVGLPIGIGSVPGVAQ